MRFDTAKLRLRTNHRDPLISTGHGAPLISTRHGTPLSRARRASVSPPRAAAITRTQSGDRPLEAPAQRPRP